MKKIMVYPGDHPANVLSLIPQFGNILANYGQSILVQADDNAVQILQDHAIRFREIPEQPLLQTGAFIVDTDNINMHATSAQAAERAFADVSATSGSTYHILRLAGPLHPDWKTQLEDTGVRFEQSMDEYFYLVEINNDRVDDVQQLPFVETVTVYEPELKINPVLFSVPLKTNLSFKSGLMLLETTDDIQPVDSPITDITETSRATPPYQPETDGNIEVIVKPAASEAVPAAIESAGGKVISVNEDRIIAFAPPENLMNIARIEAIKELNPYAPYKLHNNIAGGIIQVTPFHNGQGLRGAGQVVAVADTGLDTGKDNATLSADFRNRIVKIVPLGRPGDASDTDGHGTHVAGSVLGSGANSNSNVQGMAPEASLFFQSVLDSSGGLRGLPSNLRNLFSPALQNGAFIHTNSWGFTIGDGSYNSNSGEADEFAFRNRDFLILFAAGNEGRKPKNKITPPGTAKNVLTVGASKSVRTLPGSVTFPASPRFPGGAVLNIGSEAGNHNQMADFSSVGPVQNNRRKPDIVAPGSWILSARSTVAVADHGLDGLPLTGDETGVPTHHDAVGIGLPGGPVRGKGNQNTPALPAGAGTAANQLYMYESGTSMATPIVAGACTLLRQYLITKRGHSPSAALIKAFAINGAVDMGMGVPHPAQGWGRLDLSNTLSDTVKFDDTLNHALRTGDTHTYNVVVAAANTLAVTLVWRDAPGATLQNRLHLRVIHTSSNTVLMSDPINDIRNNVQKVVVKNATPGNYRIEVEGVNISIGIPEFAGAIRQDYALAVINATGPGLL
ncbi:S8 family serine peptidase [Pseudoflavitalea sp. X16]|uniref:S8 family serine peptidase n=1 Tax=Paraflavitalea devenefica TaxID=2716334 RepID=UPI00141EB3D4|nr:S8 family serine peptidase [Paraflavitalea devenefica]NII27353.1 S8 family serine peptidase [Paraflavitalea devenefica]